jgi:hypothetical protein
MPGERRVLTLADPIRDAADVATRGAFGEQEGSPADTVCRK